MIYSWRRHFCFSLAQQGLSMNSDPIIQPTSSKAAPSGENNSVLHSGASNSISHKHPAMSSHHDLPLSYTVSEGFKAHNPSLTEISLQDLQNMSTSVRTHDSQSESTPKASPRKTDFTESATNGHTDSSANMTSSQMDRLSSRPTEHNSGSSNVTSQRSDAYGQSVHDWLYQSSSIRIPSEDINSSQGYNHVPSDHHMTAVPIRPPQQHGSNFQNQTNGQATPPRATGQAGIIGLNSIIFN